MDAAAHEACQRLVLVDEGANAMRKAQLATVLRIGALAHGTLEVAQVAHHIGAARTRHAKPQEETVVAQQPHLQAHRARRLSPVARNARLRHGTRAVEKGRHGTRGAHVLEVVEPLVGVGVAVEVERQGDAVLAGAREPLRRRAAAVIGEELVADLVDGDRGVVGDRIARCAVNAGRKMREIALVAAASSSDAPLALRDDAGAPKDRGATRPGKGGLADHRYSLPAAAPSQRVHLFIIRPWREPSGVFVQTPLQAVDKDPLPGHKARCPAPTTPRGACENVSRTSRNAYPDARSFLE